MIAKIIRRLFRPHPAGLDGAGLLTNTSVPPLEKVAEAHNVALSARTPPSLKAMLHIGRVFNEFSSDNAAMIVIGAISPRAPGARLLRPHRS